MYGFSFRVLGVSGFKGLRVSAFKGSGSQV